MQDSVASPISIDQAALKRARRIRSVRRLARSVPSEIARRITIALRQDRLLAQLGAGTAWQIAVLPSDINGLVEQVLVVETEAIRWGGRPPRIERHRGLAILDGDWDICCKQPIQSYLDSVAVGRSIHELFVEERPYTEPCSIPRWWSNLSRGIAQESSVAWLKSTPILSTSFVLIR